MKSNSDRGDNNRGLFHELASSGVITTLGVRDAYLGYKANIADPANYGILAAVNKGAIVASYTTGYVRFYDRGGGLVGRMDSGSIKASYSTAAVSAEVFYAGGLVGEISGGSITGSYYAGNSITIDGASQTKGGLVGGGTGGTIATDNYWDDSPTAVPNTSPGSDNSAGKTTAQLQGPTAYGAASSIYYTWNLDLDGTTGGDDPWDFGTSSQYPILKYGGHTRIAQGRTGATDHDADNDGLIDITTLAQLDAIRHDLDGDGAPTAGAGKTAYAAAFSGGETGEGAPMGCPYFTGCRGYELMNDLDFDTDGDGSTHSNGVGDADDDYNNNGAGWLPIHSTQDWAGRATGYSKYTGEFHGRGHVIANLYINRVYFNYASLFAQRAVAEGHRCGAAQPGDPERLRHRGAPGGPERRAGGGQLQPWRQGVGPHQCGRPGGANGPTGQIVASYATAAVECTASGPWRGAGGLVASAAPGYGQLRHCAVTESTGLAPPGCPHRAGLALGRAAVTASYWNSDTTTPVATNPGGTGKTTAELQSPTAYGAGANDIYKDWNVDVDGDGVADDPGDFGTSSQYPALKYGGFVPAFQGRPTDYDDDNDGLIDIRNLAQLDAVRYDLDGQGDQDTVSAANWAKYQKAFPNPIAGMGCRLTRPRRRQRHRRTAHLHGLRAAAPRLDFDTNGNGKTHTSGTGDASDDYNNGGAGWTPIGGIYNATFQGNGHTIDNLFIRRTNTSNLDGLFQELGGNGVITTPGRAGRLHHRCPSGAGQLQRHSGRPQCGAIVAAYTTGEVRGEEIIGGIAGTMTGGSIKASYSTATVSSRYEAGGLVGDIGGGAITGSYYAGNSVTSATNSPSRGGLVGQRTGGAISNDSYWDDSPAGVPATSAGSQAAAGKTTAELQNPVCYTGIYAPGMWIWTATAPATSPGTLAPAASIRSCSTGAIR